MSAKLLYSLSDEKKNLKKQIGCMNGLLQYLDPHYFINNRSTNNSSHKRITPGENKQQGTAVNNAMKRSKEKKLNVIKEMQVSPIESSRLSVSSSTSTHISSSEYDWTTKPEQSPLAETVCRERYSWDNRTNLPDSSPQQPSSPGKKSNYFQKKHTIRETVPTRASPIKTTSREMVKNDLKHVDSPRLSNSSRPDSPRLTALTESFRSISSNQSAPAATPRNKDPARLSYDSRETRDVSSLTLRDLPRLSLDSKQRTTKESVHRSNDDLLRDIKKGMHGSNKIQTLPEEPTSYRAPSNIVAKLMGLEALPDFIPSTQGSSTIQCSNSFSRSSRTIDESKVDFVSHSPRKNSKEIRTPRSNKAKSAQPASMNQEADSEPRSNPLTIYGAIEKRLADLDFQKSGKDLRALKQILESMHREKNKLEMRQEHQSSHCISQMSNSSSFHISQQQGPEKATPPTSEGFKSVIDIKTTRDIKLKKLVKGSRKEAAQAVQDIPQTSLHRVRIAKPVDGTKDAIRKKMAKDLKESHHIMNKYSKETTPRPIRIPKAPEHTNKVNLTSSAQISDTGNTNIYRASPATSGSGVKHAMGLLSKNRKLPRNSSTLQEADDQSSEFSNDSACLSQQGDTNSLLSQSNNSVVSHIHRVNKNADESCNEYETLQQVNDNKNSESTRGDAAFEELKITIREQPSPVSVLDADFYEDESPSPVKRKPIAFKDFEANATFTRAEWKDTDSIYSPGNMRPDFNYEGDCEKLQNFKESTPAVWRLTSYQNQSLSNETPLYKPVNLEKSYVSELLSASGLLDYPSYTVGAHLVPQSQEVIKPSLFFVLEQTKGSSFISNKRCTSKAERRRGTNERNRRKLLFDAVNEILSQKLYQPRPLLQKQPGLRTSSPSLLKEILKELDQLQNISLANSLDDEDDFLTTIIGKDLTHRSLDWTDVSGEIPALVLDIERLIFKDLIVELVHDEATETQARKNRIQ